MARPQLLFDSNAIPTPSAEPLRVIVAGLDMDYRGVPFGAMPLLMAQMTGTAPWP